MRIPVLILVSGVAFTVLVPFLVIAATTPAVAGANIAPSTPADAKACILKLFQAQNKKNAASGAPANATTGGLTDTCTSESVTVDTTGAKLTITQTGRVGNNDLKNGCIVNSCSAPDCGITTVVISLSGSLNQTKTISKCDPNYQKDLSTASGNTPDMMKNLALQSIAQKAIQEANIGTLDGQQQLTQALTKFGVSSEDAQKVVTADVANGTTNSQDLLKAFASQDPNQISQAASTAGITLNQATINDITSLTPAQVSDKVSSLYTPDEQNSANNIISAASTFAAPDASAQAQPLKGGANAQMIAATEQQYNLQPGALANICNFESGGCTSICNKSGSACGPFQYTTGTWAGVTTQMCSQGVAEVAQYCSNGSIDPGLRLNPYVATQVAGWNISQNLAKYGPLIAQTGIDQGTAAYIMQGLGTGGAAQFFRAYINNPNMSTADFLYQTQPASAANILANNGNLYAGQTLQGTVNRFAANLGAAPSGSSGVGSLYSGIVSPFSVDTNTYGGVSTGGVSSPFSGVSNFSSTPGVGSTQSASYGQPIQYSQQSQNSQQSQTNSLNSNGATQTTSTTGATTVSPGQTGAAVAQIIAQPKTVRRGTSVTVAWSSVGMSNASPCHVYENNSTQVANTNEGSRLVTTSTTGTLTFSLICTAQGTSATVQNTYSVVVQ